MENFSTHRRFNPRSRTGNDIYNALFFIFPHRVSIHVPARGTTILHCARLSKTLFQSTFPHGERLAQCANFIVSKLFQSTFPHGERPGQLCELFHGQRVSIHVPARGTTITVSEIYRVIDVSIHVPARGTTQIFEDIVRKYGMFQSTFPHGERQTRVRSKWKNMMVSIHVPARGTTRGFQP